MKGPIYFSCITLYLVANQAQIVNSVEPISMTLFTLFVSVLGIFGFIESNIFMFLPASSAGDIYKPSGFYDSLGLIKNSKLQISLSEEIKIMLNDISIRNELRPYKYNIEHIIGDINSRYEHILPYKRAKLQSDNLTDFDINTLKRETSLNIGTGTGTVYDLIRELNDDLIGREKNNFVYFLLESMKANTIKTCSTQKEIASFQQSLDKLLSGIFITYMKAYFVIRFSEEFLNDHGMTKDVSHSISLNDTMTKLEGVMKNTIEGFKKEMSRSSRDVWLCDPSVHEEGVTFETLAGNYHKQIVPQYVLDGPGYGPQNKNADGLCENPCNSDFKRLPLWESDPNKQLTPWEIRERERYGFSYGSPYYISQPETLFNCKSLRSVLPIAGNYSTKIHYYDYTDTPYKSGNMKFRQFKKLEISTQEELRTYGPKIDVVPPTRIRVHENTGVWTTCDICTCLAEESFVYYSASQVIADKEYVITGVRILRNSSNTSLDKYIHFQIQQGKLLENGAIDNSSLNWKAIDYDALNLTAPLVEMDAYKRITEMYDIDLPPNKVMVGIGFERNPRRNGVNLKITARSFNFTTGKINHTDSTEHLPKIIYNNLIDTEDNELPNPGDKSTIVATNVSVMYSTSSFIHDLGQTTVPFLDIQNVTTSRPTPMGGAGLYYKYKEGYAGYIGIKLKTYDFLQNVNDNPLSVEEAAKLIYNQLLQKGAVQDDTRVLFKD